MRGAMAWMLISEASCSIVAALEQPALELGRVGDVDVVVVVVRVVQHGVVGRQALAARGRRVRRHRHRRAARHAALFRVEHNPDDIVAHTEC